MRNNRLTEMNAWKRLEEQAGQMHRPENHLKNLLGDAKRLERFSAKGGGLFFDFSRQRLKEEGLALLAELAGECGITDRFRAMMAGEIVNTTENRAALHTALRDFSDRPVRVKGADIKPELRRVLSEIEAFSGQVHSGAVTGSTGKRFTDVVVVGIGGSYLGTEFVANALEAKADKGVRLHFLANVDIHNFDRIAAAIDPEATLWVIVSKSYTTPETAANEQMAITFMRDKGLDPDRHIATVTAKGSPGDDPARPIVKAFHMFDFIGGRYSVCSAVGGVPLSLYLGFDRFKGFLEGASAMDEHAASAPVAENLPALAALISVWNNNFLHYPAQGIIPYADPLRRLAGHVQQLYMESNGKGVTRTGDPLSGIDTGAIVFGEPGTNAQHSFFQLAHQGRPFPIDFIGVLKPACPADTETYGGVTNHQELWANLLSQPMALAMGKEDPDPARRFPGNRPSSTLLMPDLSPESVGALLSFYEARTVMEGFIWDVNPFDQFGVELGKTMAKGHRQRMAKKNRTPGYAFEDADPVDRFYLNALFSGKF